MNIFSAKRLVTALILSVASFITLPAFSWPDVDHMNMCGDPAKTVRAYGGSHQGWDARDHYISTRGMAYYFRTMCPDTKEVKMKKAAYKKPVLKKVSKEKKEAVEVSNKKKETVKVAADKIEPTKEVVVKKAIKKTPVLGIAKRSSYNHKLDCARVDKMNGTGSIVKVVRKR